VDAPAISNPDKVFWPAEGYTKRNLCDYYAAVAGFMLPFLRGRPVVLVRYPDGVSGKNFYQWRAPEGTPSWMRTLELRDEERAAQGDSKCVFLLDDVAGLVHVANLGCIPIHVLASTERALDECDFLTIDLDIGPQPFKSAVILALALRELLDEVGLVGFPKTSGQKGLHVLIPLAPGVSFDAAKLLVELLGRLLVARHPQLATMERRISKRGPKVYVDTGQTGRSRTIVAPYSVRAHPGATVSTPLGWDELHVGLDPARFTLSSVPVRLAELGDPMANLLAEAREVGPAVRRLESKLRSA
jgi:bifunctional non-homologous end joining protein LigD